MVEGDYDGGGSVSWSFSSSMSESVRVVLVQICRLSANVCRTVFFVSCFCSFESDLLDYLALELTSMISFRHSATVPLNESISRPTETVLHGLILEVCAQTFSSTV